MIRRTGHADLPLHSGTVPRWLADRMMALGTLIVESIVCNFGRQEVLVRLSDPLWFQSLGAVMGMDWHSSGITTSVMYALKRGLNPRAKELGICICGGRGTYSRRTPGELAAFSEKAGLDGAALVRASRLCAKVDNTAVQDGFQLYQHNFILTSDGSWAVVQQGMNPSARTARRYHWCSAALRSFVEEPHTGVVGEGGGAILNLTASDAARTRSSIVEISGRNPERVLKELRECGAEFSSARPAGARLPSESILKKAADALQPVLPGFEEECAVQDAGRSITLPRRHDVRAEDVDARRLGAVLAAAYESQPQDFESLLLTPGLGPRTLQSLALVSEMIYGTPTRFRDPARFSFAHGGKDGHPFPVPLKIYDESIRVLRDSIKAARLGVQDKSECLRRLHTAALQLEERCRPEADFDALVRREHEQSHAWGGRTVFGDA